ncbi:short-chain dehydrogenase [Sphingobium sp. C100]|jgi:meso-butanediol dehydrogenase / (S,S)-butanediol dehydrogenase / diacetyl reductase|uniref:SDR family oxidoreductase n=1 Tax=Sphingobium sp. C100 TaxID=1207055 RepID=UPI0003D661DF|nr:SDR family NAD(P)-dependent oxidoreductase [Sphingobium sp. C100]ETI61155.1 short-chain dehydrogenase [Sphingobium sp. C100]PHQ63702.1 MAG: hypothetical protein COC10_04685 [Sphingobium sp.]
MSKRIVITGAGAGLGRALARGFAADGHDVVLLGRTLSKVEAVAAEIGDRALALGCDVASPDSIRAAFAKIAARHQAIDVLINNAAIYAPFTIASATDEQIFGGITTNLIGPMLCSRSAIPMMTNGGQIINVSSESVALPFPHLSVYRAGKAGLEMFSDALQLEVEGAGISVTCVRAGSMHEEGKQWDIDRDAAMAFHSASVEAGLDLRNRPMSHTQSPVDIFRAIIGLPADLRIGTIALHARKQV